ncbi:UDP-N-acetyl-alpha-D-muramoyl-L-alanyl-L-glutamate epimerase [Candidatus Magnetomoraceae bacterium gMMP-15]
MNKNLPNDTFDQLRKIHPRFIYKKFNWSIKKNSLKINFHFFIEPDINFNPCIIIESDTLKLKVTSSKLIDNMVFHLGLIEMLSYWKAACPPQIIIEPMNISSETMNFWYNLFYKGMGEFFYINNIDFNNPSLVNVNSNSLNKEVYFKENINLPSQKNLLLVSGGKDSSLCAKFLMEIGANYDCLMINPTKAAWRISRLNKNSSVITVKRTIDSELIKLNKKGYLNGHTPFSAILAMLGVICAAVYGHNHVIASNESSCNIPYLKYLGKEINHQYSKTFEFESIFDSYTKTHFSDINYLSLIRPLSEIQIACLLSNYPDLFKLIRSCNKNYQTDSWCMSCAKCVSVFTLLYPLCETRELLNLFNNNIFDNMNNLDILLNLLGETGKRPLECVAPENEILIALYLGLKKHQKNNSTPPAILRYIEKEILPNHKNISNRALRMLNSWDSQNYIPNDLANLMQQKLRKTIKEKLLSLI